MKDSWTDERLDDLNDKVGELARRTDNGFNRVDADIREMRSEMNARFEHIDARFDAMQRGFDARFDALQRTMIQFGGLLIAALIGVIATQI